MTRAEWLFLLALLGDLKQVAEEMKLSEDLALAFALIQRELDRAPE